MSYKKQNESTKTQHRFKLPKARLTDLLVPNPYWIKFKPINTPNSHFFPPSNIILPPISKWPKNNKYHIQPPQF